ncbi:MAG: AMIN-like domain-containing (lipo)protein [Candidatus Limnocylindria bacterium]
MRRTSFGALILIPLLAACAGQGAGSGSDLARASATPVASLASMPAATGTPSAAPTLSAEAIPSADLGPFSCDLPIEDDGSAAVANIVDVRVGTHDGYDRVVFEFEQGTPDLTLDSATPPFTADASGQPIDVSGDSFLSLTMRGGTKQTDDGTSSYDGPTEFDPDFSTLINLVEGGDFERQSTWYLGLAAESCVRLIVLDGPPRIAIDIEH